MNRSSDVDMFISRLSRTCHATFVLVVIDSCASDPRSAIRGQRMATTESPPVCSPLFAVTTYSVRKCSPRISLLLLSSRYQVHKSSQDVSACLFA